MLVRGGDDEGSTAPTANVKRVAERLERVRKLRFKTLPPVHTVSADDAREAGLAIIDKEYPPKERADDEQVLELLGLIPAGSDLRDLTGKILGQEVAGFYDDKKKEMTLVEGSGTGFAGEITLAHELTHALEDQHFGIHATQGLDDEQTAHTALTEGTATVAMVDYAVRFLAAGRVRREAFIGQLQLADLLGSTSGLPPYIQRSLVFPYAAGARFVDAIGTWGPANAALRGRGPISTEQILHPRKYESHEAPLHVSQPPAPGPGWERSAAGTVGEFDTGQLIRSSDSALRAERAAAGWGGGRYTLWRRGKAAALSVGWRWDTPRDAAEFVAALPRYIEKTLGGRAAGAGVWRSPARSFVAAGPGARVRLAIAPTRRLALRLAR